MLRKHFNCILVLSIFFASCRQGKVPRFEYYSNGNIKNIQLPNNLNEKRELHFFQNGELKSIINYSDSLNAKEQLTFFESNGFLKSKLLFKNNKAEGSAYWFYESGAIQSSRYYTADKENSVGFDYWDYSFVINKTLVRFNALVGIRIYLEPSNA